MSNMTEPSPTGKKFDAEKPRVGLMVSHFPRALTAVARCDTMGAKKYGEDNLFQVADAKARYMDAAYRHLLADSQGEEADPESGESHLAHAAWNILAVLEMRLRGDGLNKPVYRRATREEKIDHPGVYFVTERNDAAGKEFS